MNAASRHPGDGPSVALALGGGGARGLAHIVVLEALDDLGIVPTMIAGTSIGAIIGAAYAAGLPGKALRDHVLRATRDRAAVIARLLKARVGKISDLFQRQLGNPVLIDAERFLDLFWPEAVPDRFEDLVIPFKAIAADFHARGEAVLEKGALVTAVGASMAIPGLMRPVAAGGRVFIDGGAVDPLPIAHVAGSADIVIAVDVSGGSIGEGDAIPEPFEAMLGASSVMQHAIVAARLESHRPDILLKPAVEGFHLLDFFKARAILEAAAPLAVELKAALALRGFVDLSPSREPKAAR